MTSSCRISATDGAFLKVTLQDVASGEGVSTEDTHVRAVTSVCARLDRSAYGKKEWAYVGGDDASSALRASKS